MALLDLPAEQPMFIAIQSVQRTVTMARALVTAGRRVDLTGLDADVAVLCTAIGMLPQDRARPLRAPLEDLLQDVEGLAISLNP